MCGRFTLTVPLQEIEARFEAQAAFDTENYRPSYNVAPSQMVAAVIHGAEKKRLGFLKWGFIPSWAKDPAAGYKMINARSETIAEKASFRAAFRKKRCFIIADSFYEWNRKNGTNTPMRIRLKKDKLFAMAGIWDKWVDASGKPVFTCAILTTKANGLMAEIHDRMPVILRKEDEEKWLDPRLTNPDELLPLLKPYDSSKMEAYEVPDLVNSPKNNTPELLLPKKQT